VYDDAEDQFYQGYPSQGRRGRGVAASILASIITTVVVFFGLRELDLRGYLGSHTRARTAAPAASAGGQTVQVPDLVGLRLEQGRELLKGRGLLISIAEERENASQPPGAILAQNPAASAAAAPSTTVQVILARAPAGLVVPPLTGTRPEDATRQLAAKGLQVGPQAKSAPSETVGAGLVLATEPPMGTTVQAGSTVVLVLAAGKPAAVPKVVGIRLSRAKKLLEEAGFKVGKTVYKYDPCCGEYIILRQTPSEGESASAGAVVDLIVNEPG
jgi:eukaryotic-like serine/threonine-protein kinase